MAVGLQPALKVTRRLVKDPEFRTPFSESNKLSGDAHHTLNGCPTRVLCLSTLDESQLTFLGLPSATYLSVLSQMTVSSPNQAHRPSYSASTWSVRLEGLVLAHCSRPGSNTASSEKPSLNSP